jgi:hypothetical protein
VTEAGTLDQETVVAALDHAQIAEGPGGPAAMVPGQHHPRLHMYIARARDGRSRSSRTSAQSTRKSPQSARPSSLPEREAQRPAAPDLLGGGTCRVPAAVVPAGEGGPPAGMAR